jgi:hypothetical protein
MLRLVLIFFYLKTFLDYFSVDLGRDDDLELILLQNNKEIPKNPDFRHEREGNTWEF